MIGSSFKDKKTGELDLWCLKDMEIGGADDDSWKSTGSFTFTGGRGRFDRRERERERES